MTLPPAPSRPLRADAVRNRRALLDAALVAFRKGGVMEDGLLTLAERGERLLNDSDPVAAVAIRLDAFVARAGLFDGLARTLVNPETGDDTTCKRSKRAGAALPDRAVDAGQLRQDVSSSDLLDIAAAIAWLGDQGRDDAQRSRLLALVLDGMRQTSRA